MSPACAAALILVALLATHAAATLRRERTFCTPGNSSCWPNAAAIGAFRSQLSNGDRVLRWYGPGTPRPCAVPQGSPGEQPLYGLGWDGLPKVAATDVRLLNNASRPLCVDGPTGEGGCFDATRNNPLHGWKPGFVVWALVPSDVQAAIEFAHNHSLCVSVLGTGHDFLNRHSCATGGVLIRTTLMKGTEFEPNNTAHGAFKFGPGLTFSECHKAAADHDRVVASGWASTVGILGWSIGGGHGPFSPKYGLGVDNIVSLDVVTSPSGHGRGEVVTCNATMNSDLFQALRGGGGSTWGVVVSITIRAHPIPAGGFAVAKTAFVGSFCDGFYNNVTNVYGRDALEQLTGQAFDWMLGHGTDFGGLTWWWSQRTDDPAWCGANWTVWVQYAYLGPPNSTVLVDSFTNLTANGPVKAALAPFYKGYANWFEYVDPDCEPIMPWPWLAGAPPSNPIGGLPSVLVDREQFEAAASPTRRRPAAVVLIHALEQCGMTTDGACHRSELYQDITGNVGSPQPAALQSLSPGMRRGMVHWIGGSQLSTSDADLLYTLGNFSYFGESAHEIEAAPLSAGAPVPAWARRLWGDGTFRSLQATKARWDPAGTFWCHYCVGDE
jgi:ribonuclease T2